MNETKKPRVKLTGVDGNAMEIVRACRIAARNSGWGEKQIEKFSREALSGHYNHVLQTAMKYFDVS